MIDTLIKQIKNLPPLPKSVMKIQQLCNQRDTDIDELVSIIENDPMLHANIIKAVNSPLYGMSKEVVSVLQAVMLFGISMVRGFAAAIAIRKTIPVELSPYHITAETLSETSTIQAALVREWYVHVDRSMVQNLQSLALLMEMGKVVCAQEILVLQASRQFEEVLQHSESIDEAEYRILGASSYEVSAMMFEQWNFDYDLIEILRHISRSENVPQQYKTYVQVLKTVKTAVNVKEMLTDRSLKRALKMADDYQLDTKALLEAARTVQSKTE